MPFNMDTFGKQKYKTAISDESRRSSVVSVVCFLSPVFFM